LGGYCWCDDDSSKAMSCGIWRFAMHMGPAPYGTGICVLDKKDSKGNPDRPCWLQAYWGFCGEWWMKDKCLESCGKCKGCGDQRPNGAWGWP
jgi:hypothetical protein